jgi:hypothetical protein
MYERKQLLERKLEANRQRLERKAYLNKLSEKLRKYLSEKEYIQTSEKKELTGVFWIRAGGLGEIQYKPRNYSFQEFSWKEEVLFAAKSVGNKYDNEQAFFSPFMNNPTYCVEFGWVRNNLEALFDCGDYSLGVVTTDLNTGIVIDHYCGYLSSDPNPDEIVFELATWGF